MRTTAPPQNRLRDPENTLYKYSKARSGSGCRGAQDLRVRDGGGWAARTAAPTPKGARNGRGEAAAAAVHAGDGGPEGAGRGGRVEHPRPGAGRGRVHRRLGLAQP